MNVCSFFSSRCVVVVVVESKSECWHAVLEIERRASSSNSHHSSTHCSPAIRPRESMLSLLRVVILPAKDRTGPKSTGAIYSCAVAWTATLPLARLWLTSPLTDRDCTRRGRIRWRAPDTLAAVRRPRPPPHRRRALPPRYMSPGRRAPSRCDRHMQNECGNGQHRAPWCTCASRDKVAAGPAQCAQTARSAA